MVSMTAYDDDADRLGEECEFCGEIYRNCKCDKDNTDAPE